MRVILAIGAIVASLLFETKPPADPPADPGDDGFDGVKGKLADLIDARIAEKMPGVIDQAFERWLQPAEPKASDPPTPKADDPPTGDPAPAPAAPKAERPAFLDVLFGSRS